MPFGILAFSFSKASPSQATNFLREVSCCGSPYLSSPVSRSCADGASWPNEGVVRVHQILLEWLEVQTGDLESDRFQLRPLD